MYVDPHILIAAFMTLGAGWMMLTLGLEKNVLERKRRRRVCPSCGRNIAANVCANCAG